MDGQEKSDFQKLLRDFETHVALSEERWASLRRDQESKKLADAKIAKDMQDDISKLNKLVWSVGGSVIFILASALLAGAMK